MVLFVDHDADRFVVSEHDSFVLHVLSVSRADQVLFDQELALQRRDLGQGEKLDVTQGAVGLL